MSKILALTVAVLIGAITSIQAAMNTELGEYVGGVTSTLISFIAGTLTITIVYIVLAEKGLREITKVPPYLLFGGVLGAIFVFGIIKVIPVIGVSSGMAGVIAGQLILAMLIDHFGLFGSQVYNIGFQRIFAAILLLVSVKMMSK